MKRSVSRLIKVTALAVFFIVGFSSCTEESIEPRQTKGGVADDGIGR